MESARSGINAAPRKWVVMPCRWSMALCVVIGEKAAIFVQQDAAK
jgi:hypothetical protein